MVVCFLPSPPPPLSRIISISPHSFFRFALPPFARKMFFWICCLLTFSLLFPHGIWSYHGCTDSRASLSWTGVRLMSSVTERSLLVFFILLVPYQFVWCAAERTGKESYLNHHLDQKGNEDLEGVGHGRSKGGGVTVIRMWESDSISSLPESAAVFGCRS